MKMEKKYNVAVVGATGLVGGEILKVLDERNFPIKKIKLLASSRSAGKKIKFKNEIIKVEETKSSSFKGLDIALFSSSEAAAGVFASDAVKSGCVVIDNSNTFRMNPDVPLVVPEVNPHALKKHKGIIANPNCSTIQMVVVLKPIHNVAKIKRVVVSTYQSVSGWGKEAVEQLWKEINLIMKNRKKLICSLKEGRVLPSQIAFNVIPQIDKFTENSYTKEEMKMVNETKKIMEDDILVSATCVRVPVVIGHSEAVNIETEKKLTKNDVIEILRKSENIVVIDNIENQEYPMPVNIAGKEKVYVGRIREDETLKYGINLWIVADNLRKGAATNAVQIAEEMIKQKLL
jgi:aspartate-semialdehyde dehydrogenase